MKNQFILMFSLLALIFGINVAAAYDDDKAPKDDEKEQKEDDEEGMKEEKGEKDNWLMSDEASVQNNPERLMQLLVDVGVPADKAKAAMEKLKEEEAKEEKEEKAKEEKPMTPAMPLEETHKVPTTP